MEAVLLQLPDLFMGIWWPFCRVLAFLSAAPILGDEPVPVTTRVLLSLALAVILMPAAHPASPIEPLSLAAAVATAQQILIGFGIGFAFQLTIAALLVLGFLVSSQMGLSMAVMNDPVNGVASDQISSVIYMLVILVFVSIDGHLVMAGVIGGSFHAFPVTATVSMVGLQVLVNQCAWIFSGALLLALPVMVSSFIVQIGLGLLNRIAPALNLYSLGFSVVTVFGLFMLSYLLRFVPDHYVRMTNQVLDLLQAQFG